MDIHVDNSRFQDNWMICVTSRNTKNCKGIKLPKLSQQVYVDEVILFYIYIKRVSGQSMYNIRSLGSVTQVPRRRAVDGYTIKISTGL